MDSENLKIQNLQTEAVRLHKLDREAFRESKFTAKEHREAFLKSESTAKEFGTVLLAVKVQMQHGEFTTWWSKQFGVKARNRITYCMRLANGKHDASQRLKVDYKIHSGRIIKNFRKLYDAARKGNVKKSEEAANQIRHQVQWVFSYAILNAKKMEQPVKARIAKAGA